MAFKVLVLTVLFVFLSAAIPAYGTGVQIVGASEEEPLFTEIISVAVNCTTAELTIFSTVSSTNSSLVRLPPEINLYGSELINAVLIGVAFSRDSSRLVIAFNNTDAATARSLADTVKGSIENAFNTVFTWNATRIEDSHVYVEYIGA
ncbi:MAG: hypothetical protein N3E47_07880, partial [Candidatus Bathyarchaeota archaeon]|nr:hypothetical protein [Candidatus Bathyarchaeota archaeon]